MYNYASLTLDGPVTSLGDTSVNDIGTLDLDPATAQTLDVGTLFVVNNSTVEGTDNLVVSPLTLTVSSTLGLSGTTTAQGGLATGSSAYVDGGTLINQGAASQNGTLTASNGARRDRQPGGQPGTSRATATFSCTQAPRPCSPTRGLSPPTQGPTPRVCTCP